MAQLGLNWFGAIMGREGNARPVTIFQLAYRLSAGSELRRSCSDASGGGPIETTLTLMKRIR